MSLKIMGAVFLMRGKGGMKKVLIGNDATDVS
jgi:hypothetical protein